MEHHEPERSSPFRTTAPLVKEVAQAPLQPQRLRASDASLARIGAELATVEGAPTELRVTVISANGLRRQPGRGSLDPYCVCAIPWKPSAEFRTEAAGDTTDPVWNHEGTLADYRPGDPLMFSVWDQEADALLGHVSLSYSQLADQQGCFEGELMLGEAGLGVLATLAVKVEKGDTAIPMIATWVPPGFPPATMANRGAISFPASSCADTANASVLDSTLHPLASVDPWRAVSASASEPWVRPIDQARSRDRKSSVRRPMGAARPQVESHDQCHKNTTKSHKFLINQGRAAASLGCAWWTSRKVQARPMPTTVSSCAV